jgi:hypothetical protein
VCVERVVPTLLCVRVPTTLLLQVIFRPTKLQQFSDHIEIMCRNGSFIVLVEAFTPATHIEVASQLDFGFNPTKETVTRSLVVRNTGDIRVSRLLPLPPFFSH